MAVSVESTVTTLGRFPQGIVGMVPTQLPANFLARAEAGADSVCEDVAARFVCDSTTRFVFGFAVCSGAGVGFSSTIGAGERSAINKIDNRIRKKRSGRITAAYVFTGAIAARYNCARLPYIRRFRCGRHPKGAIQMTPGPI